MKTQEKKLDNNLSKNIKDGQAELDDMLNQLKFGTPDINKSKKIDTNSDSNTDHMANLYDIQKKLSDLQLMKETKQNEFIKQLTEEIDIETKRHNTELKKLSE